MQKYGYLLTVVLVFVFSGLAKAAPVVSGVSWINDNTIRITGSGFGVKVPAGPQYWADFEDSTAPTNLGAITSWASLKKGELVNTNRGNINTGALRADFTSGRAEDAVGPIIMNFTYDRWYVNFKRYYDFDITKVQGPVGFNLKMNRFMPKDFSGVPPLGNNLYINYQGREGLNSGRAFNEFTNAVGATYFPEYPFKPKTWQTEQLIYQTGDVDVQNGIFNWIRDGEMIWSPSRRWQMRDSTRPYKYDILVFDQVSNGSAPGPIYVYYDNIYVDKTWARVMLCESKTWVDCVQQEIEIPVAWSDNQIDVRVNFGDLDLKSPIYAFVIDEDGNASAIGKLVPNLVSVPSAPTHLNVVTSQ